MSLSIAISFVHLRVLNAGVERHAVLLETAIASVFLKLQNGLIGLARSAEACSGPRHEAVKQSEDVRGQPRCGQRPSSAPFHTIATFASCAGSLRLAADTSDPNFRGRVISPEST